jgi:hypothetical protein
VVKSLAAGVWLATLFVAACFYDIDDTLCLLDEHCEEGSVCAVTNACVVCQGDACPPHVRCSDDTGCAEDERCADDGVCRTRCAIDAQCSSGSCQSTTCAAAFGEPCNPSYERRTQCADECVETNNHLEPVAPYCSIDCLPDRCPSDYECVAGQCRKIEGGLVCNHPDPKRSCGACVWDHCYTDLRACCEGAICLDVFATIAECDTQRTTTTCQPLASPFSFVTTSRELAECIEVFCDSGECFAGGT